MIGKPREHPKPTAAELADACAYLAYRDNPTPENDEAWRIAWFAATGGRPIHTPSRCQECGLHRTGLHPSEACRCCGKTNERRTEPCSAETGVHTG